MRVIDGKTTVLFGPEWSCFEIKRLFSNAGYELHRHESGAIEVVKAKSEEPEPAKVVPIRKVDRIPFFGMFPFSLPEHDGPGAA